MRFLCQFISCLNRLFDVYLKKMKLNMNFWKKNKEQKEKIKEEKIRYFPVKRAFALDFSDASVKGAEITIKGGKNILLAHSFVQLPSGVIYRGEVKDSEALKKAIDEVLKKARPKPIVTKYVVSSFPEAEVYLRPFEFPAALSEKQVLAAIPYEAESELPIKIGDMYTDIKFHRSRTNGHHVVFTAAPRKMVDGYISVLRALGLRPIAVDLDSPALIRSLAKPSDNPILILDIGAWSSTITVIEREMVHGYVSVAVGGSHLTQAIAEYAKVEFAEAEKIKKEKGIFAVFGTDTKLIESKIAVIFGEILKAARFHEQHTGRPAKQLIVSGGTALANDFLEYLRKNTGYEVIPGDPLLNSNLVFSEQYTQSDKDDFSFHKESFSSTIGLAIRGATPNIVEGGLNLLPETIREKYENWRINLFIALASIFIAVSVVGLASFVVYWASGIVYRNTLVEFEKRIFTENFPATEFEHFKAEITAVNQEVALLKKFDENRADIVKIAEEFGRGFPQGIEPGSVSITAPANIKDPAIVQIKGVAATRTDILNFERKLREHKDVISIDSPLSNLDRPTQAPFSISVKVKVSHNDFVLLNP